MKKGDIFYLNKPGIPAIPQWTKGIIVQTTGNSSIVRFDYQGEFILPTEWLSDKKEEE